MKFKYIPEEQINSTEDKVVEFKQFYKKHLIHLKKFERFDALSSLRFLLEEFKATEPTSALFRDNSQRHTLAKAENLITKYFSPDLLELFNKPFQKVNEKSYLRRDFNQPLLDTVLERVGTSIMDTEEKYVQEWHYKTNLLGFVHDCLFHFGLHPEIWQRDPLIYKRYVFKVAHKHTLAKQIISEYTKLISPEVLQSQYLTPYEKKIHMRLNGKLIPFKTIYEIGIASTILLDDELELFAIKNSIPYYSGKIEITGAYMYFDNETEELHANPYLIEAEIEARKSTTLFVSASRLEELQKIPLLHWDLTKLIRMCQELNDAVSNNNVYSAILLTRGIIDHVPPIFTCKNFSEVANNYQGTKSFKKSMGILDTSIRNIADAHIHSQIRSKEVLPSTAQLRFAYDFDVLLSEIVRLLK